MSFLSLRNYSVMKSGRLSKKEWDFIERNADSMTPEKIASELDRELDPILNHLRKIGKSLNKKEDFEVQAEYDLKSKPCWKEIKLQFSEEELELFLHHWKQIIAQFRRDILPTEELQILDTIKLEVLMNRALREQQSSMHRISDCESQILIEKEKQRPDKELMFSLERQIAVLRAAKESLSKDYKELQTKKSAMFKDLKATREQRIEKIENSRVTFSSLIDKILRDPQFCEEQSLYMEKMRLAVSEEKKRLGSYYKFDDGEVDRILLSSDTVMDED